MYSPTLFTNTLKGFRHSDSSTVLRVTSKIVTVPPPRKSQNMVSLPPYFTGQHTQLGNPPFYATRYVPPQHYFPRQTLHTGLYHLSKPPIRTFVIPTTTGSWNPRAATQPMLGSTYLQMHSHWPLVLPVLPPIQMNFQRTWPLTPPFPQVPTTVKSHLQNNPAPTLLKRPDQGDSSSPDVGSPLACSSPSNDKQPLDSSADDSFLSQAPTVLSDPPDTSATSDDHSPISRSLSPQVDKETDVLDALLDVQKKIARLKEGISHPTSPAISSVSASSLIKPQPQKSAVLGGNNDIDNEISNLKETNEKTRERISSARAPIQAHAQMKPTPPQEILDEHLRQANALRNKSTELNKKSSELLLELASSTSEIEKILDKGSDITESGQETLLSMVEKNQRLLSSLNQD